MNTITFRSILNTTAGTASEERQTIPVPPPAAATLATVLSNRLAQLAADCRSGRISVTATAAALATIAAMVST